MNHLVLGDIAQEPFDLTGGFSAQQARFGTGVVGQAARDLNFNAYADNRSIFRYDMEALPNEVTGSIGTSTAFAAWNAAVYVAQIEDDRLTEMTESGRTLDATREVLRRHNGLWFYDESYVISRRRD